MDQIHATGDEIPAAITAVPAQGVIAGTHICALQQGNYFPAKDIVNAQCHPFRRHQRKPDARCTHAQGKGIGIRAGEFIAIRDFRQRKIAISRLQISSDLGRWLNRNLHLSDIGKTAAVFDLQTNGVIARHCGRPGSGLYTRGQRSFDTIRSNRRPGKGTGRQSTVFGVCALACKSDALADGKSRAVSRLGNRCSRRLVRLRHGDGDKSRILQPAVIGDDQPGVERAGGIICISRISNRTRSSIVKIPGIAGDRAVTVCGIGPCELHRQWCIPTGGGSACHGSWRLITTAPAACNRDRCARGAGSTIVIRHGQNNRVRAGRLECM